MRLGYAHAQLSSLYLLSTFGTSHVRKNTRLSTPAQLQCSRSGAWEPGNEATTISYLYLPRPIPRPLQIFITQNVEKIGSKIKSGSGVKWSCIFYTELECEILWWCFMFYCSIVGDDLNQLMATVYRHLSKQCHHWLSECLLNLSQCEYFALMLMPFSMEYHKD